MVAKATSLLPKTSTPTVGEALDLPKMSGPRSFQVNLEGTGQVSATGKIESSLDGVNFFTVKDFSLASNTGAACAGFHLNGDYGPLTRAALTSISEGAAAEVLTA